MQLASCHCLPLSVSCAVLARPDKSYQGRERELPALDKLYLLPLWTKCSLTAIHYVNADTNRNKVYSTWVPQHYLMVFFQMYHENFRKHALYKNPTKTALKRFITFNKRRWFLIECWGFTVVYGVLEIVYIFIYRGVNPIQTIPA